MIYSMVVIKQLNMDVNGLHIRGAAAKSDGSWYGYHVEPARIRRCTQPRSTKELAIYYAALHWKWNGRPERGIDEADDMVCRHWAANISERNKGTLPSIVEVTDVATCFTELDCSRC